MQVELGTPISAYLRVTLIGHIWQGQKCTYPLSIKLDPGRYDSFDETDPLCDEDVRKLEEARTGDFQDCQPLNADLVLEYVSDGVEATRRIELNNEMPSLTGVFA